MPVSVEYQTVYDKYKAAGQEHVFHYYSSLPAEQQQSLLQQLSQIDPARINRIFKQATAPKDQSAAAKKLDPLPTDAYDSVENVSADQLAKWNQLGLDAIKKGQVCVVLLAGGQGTRLGSSNPKGCFDIGLPSHKSLFQLQAERIVRLVKLAGIPNNKLKWYVMTSGPTRKATEEFFVKNNYFGVDKDAIQFFEQGVLPALTEDGKIFLEDKSTVSVAPDGNGGIYASLRNSGILQDMKNRGVKYIHAYCVDNCLVRVADPQFIGYCIDKDAQCGVKVVRKLFAEEPVGIICKLNGKYGAVEYSEISKADSEAKGNGGKLLYDAANIANHFYTIEALHEFCSEEFERSLEFHIARKKIKHISFDNDQQVAPSKPNGIKLELFIFDILASLPLQQLTSTYKSPLAVYSVPRQQDFSPLKNASGAGVDCPETSKKDYYVQSEQFLRDAGLKVQASDKAYETFDVKEMKVGGDGKAKEVPVQLKQVAIEISPLVTFAGEGLKEALGGSSDKVIKLSKPTYIATIEDLRKLIQ
ncbi:hypothetical protein MIR68_000075 [Amoeboaphelidium protococcarum]|nr:hypothetical protein MIR68_000075 [Amoeboaphelidium protococcarum]